jgi:hypothetical protein
MCGEDLGQHVGQMLQQMKAVGHLARHGSPEARRFRIRLCPIPHEDLHPGMRLQPLGYGGGLSVGEQTHGPPPFEVQQKGARGMALSQGEIVHAEDLRRDDRRAGGTADHPQQRVTTHRESELSAQARPGSPAQAQADGEEACRQP